MTKEADKKRQFYRTGWLKLIIAVALFFAFSIYVWGIQLKYESTVEGYKKAFLYALIVLGAGLTYDSGKSILLMPDTKFMQFARHFGEMTLAIMFIIGFGILAVACFYASSPLAATLSYAIAIGVMFFAIQKTTHAVEIVFDGSA